jgi:hypothetical protein
MYVMASENPKWIFSAANRGNFDTLITKMTAAGFQLLSR